MNTVIRGHGVQINEDLRHHIHRRLGFALSRFGHQLHRITVRFVAGDDGRDTCRMIAHTRSAGLIVVEDHDYVAQAAASRAASRLGRAMARAMARARLAG